MAKTSSGNLPVVSSGKTRYREYHCVLVKGGQLYIFMAGEVLLSHFSSSKEGLKTAKFRARTRSFLIMQFITVYSRQNEYLHNLTSYHFS